MGIDKRVPENVLLGPAVIVERDVPDMTCTESLMSEMHMLLAVYLAVRYAYDLRCGPEVNYRPDVPAHSVIGRTVEHLGI